MPLKLRPDAAEVTWRRSGRYVTTQRAIRGDAAPTASGRSWKGKNVNVNVNLKCFSMLPEGEAYNRV